MTHRRASTISILLPNLRGGGTERVAIDLAHEFSRQGYAVEFALMRAEGEFLQQAAAAFSVVDLGTRRARHVPRALAVYLRQRRPDAVLAAIWPLTALAGMGRLLSGHRSRILVSEHGILSAQYRDWGWIHRIALSASIAVGYRLADTRVGVSAGVVKDMARLSGMRESKFHVVHNPIPARPAPSRVELERADAAWRAPAGARILTVGQFKPQKNHPLLLRAFARRFRQSDARLMCLGNGEDEAALRALAAALGIGENVLFPGFKPDPTPYYHTANLFVLSSDDEGFGNVIVEALGCGTPVVSTDCPSGPREILADGAYGTLVPVRDEIALAAAMEAALEAEHDPAMLRARAAEFAPELATRKYLDLLLGCENGKA